MFKRTDHVEIVTDQLDRTVQFYTEVLGYRVKASDRIDVHTFALQIINRLLHVIDFERDHPVP